jgi:hypothetical protein
MCPHGLVCGGDGVCRGASDGDCALGSPYLDAMPDMAPDPNPVGWWPFEEGTGDLTADKSGNNDNGTLQGGATWGTGRVGMYCVTLAGGADSVTASGRTALADLGPLTVAAWIKPASFAPVSGGAQRIVSKAPSATSPSSVGSWILVLDANTSGALTFTKAYATSDLRATSGALLTASTWQHVAATWDGKPASTGVVLYINGQPVIQGGASAQGPTPADAVYDLTIGNDSGAGRGFTGDIDDVRIYNRVLSATEIAALANM